MRANLAKSPSRRDAYVSYLFAAALAGGGYWLGTKAQKIEDQVADEIAAGAPPPDNKDPRLTLGFNTNNGPIYSIASGAAYGLSATTFLLAVYYTFRDKGKPSTGTSDIRAISFEPTLNPEYAGLGLAGSF